VTGASVAYFVQVSYGILTTGNTTGTEVEIAIPEGYYGPLVITASANVNGYILDGAAGANVNIANIVLTTAKENYRQGDTIVFDFDIITSLTTANLEYEITDHEGVTVATGTPSFTKEGSFEYTVPSDHPSTSYTARVVMTTEAGGYLTASMTVTIMDNYELQVWLGRSGYASGEYKPGQTIKVHYSINAYAAQLPVYKITLETSLDLVPQTYLVTETSGTLDYKVPSNAPTMLFFMGATLYNGLTGANIFDSGSEMLFMVNSELGAWDRSIAGMSAIDFTILVLIIVMILLLIIVPFLKGRMGAPKAPKVIESTPPPAPPSP
jgi:uncharacterized protein YfaS (alpha-2-macroglobulin family)